LGFRGCDFEVRDSEVRDSEVRDSEGDSDVAKGAIQVERMSKEGRSVLWMLSSREEHRGSRHEAMATHTTYKLQTVTNALVYLLTSYT
jgi:hypothetical protein